MLIAGGGTDGGGMADDGETDGGETGWMLDWAVADGGVPAGNGGGVPAGGETAGGETGWMVGWAVAGGGVPVLVVALPVWLSDWLVVGLLFVNGFARALPSWVTPATMVCIAVFCCFFWFCLLLFLSFLLRLLFVFCFGFFALALFRSSLLELVVWLACRLAGWAEMLIWSLTILVMPLR